MNISSVFVKIHNLLKPPAVIYYLLTSSCFKTMLHNYVKYKRNNFVAKVY